MLKEHPEISEDRMLSEIGMLFVEGFETTGASVCVCGEGGEEVLTQVFGCKGVLHGLPRAPAAR